MLSPIHTQLRGYNVGHMSPTPTNIAYLRNFIFGVEDSLVSTVGLLSGVAMAGMAREEIFVTGLILIFVEAISMAAGSFLSESSAEEYTTHTEIISKQSYISALVMFVSYAVSGFIPLLPYILFPVSIAFPVSVALALASLCVLGIIGAKLSRVRFLMTTIRMVVIGGVAIGVGVLVGSVFGV